ncbi:hypothetical protein LCGC14_2973530 [marine sediment metagenome]|uniref:Uncharacterized protein n=1 Tax=marine sediment metagenome TaxID=412755 RepID=A0A0F8ZZY0_9ZZZZ
MESQIPEDQNLGDLERNLLHGVEAYLGESLSRNILYINSVSQIGVSSTMQSQAPLELVRKVAYEIRNSDDPWLRDMYLMEVVVTGYSGYMNGYNKEE